MYKSWTATHVDVDYVCTKVRVAIRYIKIHTQGLEVMNCRRF